MKHFKMYALLIGLVLICFGCSGENKAENERKKLVESFLNTLYDVQYEDASKLYDEIDRLISGEIEEIDASHDSLVLGELYPKTFAPYFTEKAYNISLANKFFAFLPQLSVTKEADYEVQSLKQLSSTEKNGYWEYAYEVNLNETIGNQVTPYTDEVRFYVEDDNGEWKISNVRFFNREYEEFQG